MILITYDLFSNVSDLIFMVFCGLMALFFLFVPYETVQKVFPKAASPKVIRICGVVLLIVAILSVILFFI